MMRPVGVEPTKPARKAGGLPLAYGRVSLLPTGRTVSVSPYIYNFRSNPGFTTLCAVDDDVSNGVLHIDGASDSVLYPVHL